MKFSIVLPLRVLQVLLTIIILSISAYVSNWYYTATITIPPPEIGFLVAAPVLSLLSLAYLLGAPRLLPRAAHPLAALAVEATNALFYFAGFVALAVFLGRLRFCRGSVCEATKANAGLSAVLCSLWATTTGLTALALFKGKGKGRAADEVPIKDVEMKDVDVKETS